MKIMNWTWYRSINDHALTLSKEWQRSVISFWSCTCSAFWRHLSVNLLEFKQKLLNEDGLLIFIELSFHDAQSNSLYYVPFDLFFLDSQHLSSLGVTCLFDVLEKSWDGFDSDLSWDLFSLEVVFFQYIDLVKSTDITSHSCLKQWIEFMSFEWILVQDIDWIIVEWIAIDGLNDKFGHSDSVDVCLVDNV